MVFTLEPLASANLGLWFLPALLTTIAYYHYNQMNPESKPYNTKTLLKEYDFIVGELRVIFVTGSLSRFLCLG